MTRASSRRQQLVSDPVMAVGRLQRTFTGAVRASDLAEPLRSFDASAPVGHVRGVLARVGASVAGVRDQGLVVGYVLQPDLVKGTCGGAMRPLPPSAVVHTDTPLKDVLSALGTEPHVFVRSCGAVAAVITRDDVEKPAARMWLFGLVTAIEMALTGLVHLCYPDDRWRAELSPGRLQKAAELLEIRRRVPGRASIGLRLADCLQLGDKIHLLLATPATRKVLGQPSKAAGERVFRELQALRDNLAHAQPIALDDWRTILALAERLDHVLAFSGVFGWQGSD